MPGWGETAPRWRGGPRGGGGAGVARVPAVRCQRAAEWTGSGRLSGGGAATEQDVVPAWQALAWLLLLAPPRRAAPLLLPRLAHRAAWAQHRQRRHRRDLLRKVRVLVERRSCAAAQERR